ncbi:MAG: O-antigen ligase family protein [Winogradskyella sp.]|uniref:O-antigen ligase family protein n=1 Tax=Winogradskyella sp. TaxID=1883156 RepID=UPI0017CB1F96|nr:O-antigen ligase family protein [Winogradskyella sp.]
MKQPNLNTISKYAYYGLLFFLPLSTFLNNIALIVLFITVLLSKKERFSLKKMLYTTLIPFLAYVVVLNLIDLNFETKVYIKLLPLLIIPFVFYNLKQDIILKGLIYLFIGIIIAQIIAIVGIVQYFYFTEGKTVALRSYAGINEILHSERPYLGYFSALNIIVAYYIFKSKKLWVFVISALFSTAIILLISARLALLISVISIVFILFARIKINVKYLVGILGLFVVVLTIFLSFNNPLKNRFQQIKYDTRLVIWQGAYKILKETSSPVLGLKNQTKVSNHLNNYYENEAFFDYPPDRVRFVTKKYNTHNQYLNEILRGGVIGLGFLLLPFIYSIYYNLKQGKLEITLFILSLMFFLFVENLLARQLGVYIIAIILSLSSIQLHEKH